MQPFNDQGFGPQTPNQQQPPGMCMPPLMPLPNTQRQILCKCGCPFFIPYPVLQLFYAQTNNLEVPKILMPAPLEEPKVIPLPPNGLFKKATEIFKCINCGKLLIVDSTVEKVAYMDEEDFKQQIMKHWEELRNEETQDDDSTETEK